MFARNLKNIFRKEIFVKSLKFEKLLSRSFASKLNKEENIVKSPHPPLSYPDLSIDQYIWKDLQFWMNKTAIVR
jgi:hypothetical protein